MMDLERLDEALERAGDGDRSHQQADILVFIAAARAYRDLVAHGHRHEIEGGFIVHTDHDLGEGAEALDPIPFDGHQHLMALIARNYVNEISGPARLLVDPPKEEDR